MVPAAVDALAEAEGAALAEAAAPEVVPAGRSSHAMPSLSVSRWFGSEVSASSTACACGCVVKSEQFRSAVGVRAWAEVAEATGTRTAAPRAAAARTA